MRLARSFGYFPCAIAVVIACLATRSAVSQDRPRGAARPNIVIIVADDMGYSDAGCFGGEIATPNIDRLAQEGMRFTQFYNAGRCCPTRASLLTGVYPHQAGVGHMTWQQLDLPGYRSDLSHDTPTLAELLKPAGYGTYMVGKWHLTINDLPDKPKDNWPRQRGFDRYYGTIKGSGSYYNPTMLVRENKPISPATDPEYKPASYYYTDAIADESARFVREHHRAQGDRPFFLYVAFTSPHWPLQAPEETVAKYKGKYDKGYAPIRAARYERMKAMGLIDPAWELSPQPLEWSRQKEKAWEARCMEVYAAQIDRMDQGIGRIMEAVGATGQADNTLVLFLQDNGGCAETNGRGSGRNVPKGMRGGVGVMPGAADTFLAYGRNWANVSNTPFREYKHYVHEGGISTPLIARWPAGIGRRGQLERQPGHLVDIVPTCLELAGMPFPAQFNGRATTPAQGVSLAPAFQGDAPPRERPIFFEHEGNRAVRDGRWKLVAKGTDGPWELYDMQVDRTEMHDLAGKEPERAKAMASAWQKWAEASNVLPLRPWAKPGAPQAEE
jgi:arylsulfatase A-like enzyme